MAGVDAKGRLLLGVTEGLTGGMSLYDVRRVFRRKNFNVRDLLNLDGGSSSQMEVSLKGHRFSARGLGSVPVLVVVVGRGKGDGPGPEVSGVIKNR